MRGSTKKDAGKVIALMLIICIVFKCVLVPMYQADMKKELPAATEQLTSCETRNIS